MSRLLYTVLVTALLFSGLVAAAGGHPEAWLDDGDPVLVSDGDAHPTGLLEHDIDDHCCHSAAHFAGMPPCMIPPIPHPGASGITPVNASWVGLSYPPLPKPPRT